MQMISKIKTMTRESNKPISCPLAHEQCLQGVCAHLETAAIEPESLFQLRAWDAAEAWEKTNQQLPVCPPSCWWTDKKLQHIYVSCGLENECWKMSQKWELGHTWKVLLSQHAWSVSPCLAFNAFQDTHEIKMTLMTRYFDSSCRNRAMNFLYKDFTYT